MASALAFRSSNGGTSVCHSTLGCTYNVYPTQCLSLQQHALFVVSATQLEVASVMFNSDGEFWTHASPMIWFICFILCQLHVQIKLMGTRENAADQDFSGIPLEEEEESHLKDAAVISMGTEISGEDMMNIEALCDQVLSPHSLLTPCCSLVAQKHYTSVSLVFSL